MRLAPLAAALVLMLTGLSGCADILDPLTRPDYKVRATEMTPAPGWNRDGLFRVLVDQPVAIEIVATDPAGRTAQQTGTGDVTLEIPDGTWDLTYRVGGYKWGEQKGLRIDSQAPVFTGLEVLGTAPQGNYQLGAQARVTGANTLSVIDLQTGRTLGSALPVQLTGLTDGLQLFLVTAMDEAGNVANETVQVRVGSAVNLPAGQYTFGVVARYANEVAVWDLKDMGAYASRAAAQKAAPEYLGAGFGVSPDDPAVRAVVAKVVTNDMNTMQAAHALFVHFAETMEYDETRLDSEFLMTPRQVLLDAEDAQGRDANEDGLVDDGGGNGVKGGICRDLAATYVSLLRASGVPARLVSGYVAGTVNGFHAWAEFYAGPVNGQKAWVPVDVSPIDGPYRDAVLMQAFAVRLPDYLPLRPLPAASEVEGWSTALSVAYKWPQDKPAPVVEFEKKVTNDVSIHGFLCFNPTTRARAIAQKESACSSFGFYIGGTDNPFTTRTQRTIDYGIDVKSAARGSQITAEVAYPFPEQVVPDQVDYQFYGKAFTRDEAAGKVSSTFTV